MKKLALFCFIVISIHARADLLITEMIDANGQSKTETIKIKGDMIRSDSGARSSIINTSSSDMITINNEQKTFSKMSGSQLLAAKEKLQAMLHSSAGAQNVERVKPVDTGKSEKVNEYDAEIYTAQTPANKFTYWVSKDYPNATALKDQMSKLRKSIQSTLGPAGSFLPDTSTLPGITLKTETVISGRTTTRKLVSVKDTSVDDADFQVPAGYAEKQMRGFNGAPGGPSGAKPSQ